MRRYKKKELLKTVSTLERANDTIIKSVKANPSGAAEALALCQESAIVMGNYIESLDEKYAYLVRILEDYCEDVFRMNEAVPDEMQCRKTAKKIQKQLNRLRHGIINDLPDDRKEIVFLPYKASMWDSMESVWKAADADENTDAYVIPIPYFEKNPDGTFCEMQYEGNQYPKYVPVIYYEEYDLEAYMPDVIYIHNPYDECNHVTSVHPYFYAKNLRNFTDCLVYIPYFVLKEIDPNDQEGINGIKHFCFLPGTIYADQVIVQSENMRQIYINEYIKAAKAAGLGNGHTDRRFLEKKFLGTGSPKIDKVLNTKIEDLEIPPEWLKVIEKPDGSRKKIIFYNISVGALLHNDEKMLRKIELVFEIFKENRDVVALLWRPHPLIEATIKSMRPKLWEGYLRIRERYVEEGWGIYDDTADLDRAVVFSDAYYGDWSSVVQLCQKKGMPVMVQDADVQDAKLNGFPCSISVVCQEGSSVWFVGDENNTLWNMDIETNKIQYIASLPLKNEEDTYRIYRQCIKAGNTLFCLPDRADKVLAFGIAGGGIECCNIDTDENRIGVYNSWKYENRIWCVSYFMQKIIEINICDRRIMGMYSVFEDKAMLSGHEAVMKGRYIYCVARNATEICKFDTKTKNVQYYNLPVDDRGFNTIVWDRNKFYLTGYKKVIYVWDEKKENVTIIEKFPSGYIVSNDNREVETEYYDMPVFFKSLATKSYILFLPWNFPETFSNGIIVYRKSDQKVILIKARDDKKAHFYFCYEKPDDIVGLYCAEDNSIFEVDQDLCVKYINQFDTSGYERVLLDRKNVIREGSAYGLDALLKAIIGEFDG